jgi:hypothetical protein
MKKLKVGTRVHIRDHDFLSDGYVKEVIGSSLATAYIIKLDEKAPNTYAWETDEVFMYPEHLEEII